MEQSAPTQVMPAFGGPGNKSQSSVKRSIKNLAHAAAMLVFIFLALTPVHTATTVQINKASASTNGDDMAGFCTGADTAVLTALFFTTVSGVNAINFSVSSTRFVSNPLIASVAPHRLAVEDNYTFRRFKRKNHNDDEQYSMLYENRSS